MNIKEDGQLQCIDQRYLYNLLKTSAFKEISFILHHCYVKYGILSCIVALYVIEKSVFGRLLKPKGKVRIDDTYINWI
jgi:hypothetical protein